jgi:hypothetical protein
MLNEIFMQNETNRRNSVLPTVLLALVGSPACSDSRKTPAPAEAKNQEPWTGIVACKETFPVHLSYPLVLRQSRI